MSAARPHLVVWPATVLAWRRRLRGDFGLTRTSAGALAGNDRPANQQLAAPNAPGLPALERTGQAGDPGPAAPAHGLRLLHTLGRLGEEQFRVLRARKIQPHREQRGGTAHHAESLPDVVWLLPRRLDHGRLEPRYVHPVGGGTAPLHRCHPLSLAGPSCRPKAISRPSWDLGPNN